MKTEIFEYIKHKKQRVGVLIGKKINDKVYIGWSLCNPQDVYNDSKAFADASSRANKHAPLIVFIDNGSNHNTCPARLNYKFKILYPASINKQLMNFIDRCKRYFKTDSIANYEDKVMVELVANRDNTEFSEKRIEIIKKESIKKFTDCIDNRFYNTLCGLRS